MGWQPGPGSGAGASPDPDPRVPGGAPAPRDPRLAEFASDEGRDALLPSGRLAVAADEVSGPERRCPDATGDELAGLLRAWAAIESWASGAKLAVIAEMIRRDDAPRHGGCHGDLPDDWSPSLRHELALALACSVQSAETSAWLAWELRARLPGTGALLNDGTLTLPKARAVTETFRYLSDADAARAEALILGQLAGKTYTQVLRLAEQAALTVDPGLAGRRREQAQKKDARVTCFRELAGTAGLSGRDLPPDEALAAMAGVNARAQQYEDCGAFGATPMDVLRAYAYLDLLSGAAAGDRTARAEARDEAAEAAEALAWARARAARTAAQANAEPDAQPDAGNKGGTESTTGPEAGARGGGGTPPAPDPGTPDTTDPGTPDTTDPGTPDTTDPGTPDTTDPGTPDTTDPGTPDTTDARGNGGDDAPAGPRGCPCGARGDGCLPNGGCDDPDDDGPGGNADDRDDDDEPDDGSGGGPGGHGGPGGDSGHGRTAGRDDEGRDPEGRDPGGGGRGDDGRGDDDPGGPGGGDGPGPGRPGPGRRGPGRALQPCPPDLVVPLATLLGLAERPGEVQGFGLLDPALARDMAAAAAASPRTGICVTVTSPEGYATGHGCARPERASWGVREPGAAPAGLPARLNLTIPAAVLPGLANHVGPWAMSPRGGTGPASGAGPPDGYGTWTLTLPGGRRFTVRLDPVPTVACDHRYESHGYRPSGKLRHLVQIRDGTCTFPPCSRHARESDFEHAQPYDKGGRTCACNAGARSRACHQVKQSQGWKVSQPKPGWHAWTTPTGRTYVQEPWRYPA